jgi:RNA polymerase sigma-70 factor (ECF subfamily)
VGLPIAATFVERLYIQARGERWAVSKDRFAEALESSAQRAFAGHNPQPEELERYLGGLHLEDLALACACAAGDDGAWEHFVLDQRPHLYRAADALDVGGAARELADALYAELFGLRERDGERQSLFRHFHGRSSLTTWLRAVLAQRFVDRLRARRRLEALPDEDSADALAAVDRPVDPDRHRYLGLIQQALRRAVAGLPARDRLRLACYYAQELTLAQTGRMLGEHEATSSRQLARTRRAIREEVERRLRVDHGLTHDEVARCFESVTEDAGPLDLENLLSPDSVRRKAVLDRSS